MKLMKELGTKLFDIAFPAIFVLMLLSFSTGITQGLTNSAWQQEAVDRGYGEWYIDGQVKKWQWKELPVTEYTE